MQLCHAHVPSLPSLFDASELPHSTCPVPCRRTQRSLGRLHSLSLQDIKSEQQMPRHNSYFFYTHHSCFTSLYCTTINPLCLGTLGESCEVSQDGFLALGPVTNGLGKGSLGKFVHKIAIPVPQGNFICYFKGYS